MASKALCRVVAVWMLATLPVFAAERGDESEPLSPTELEAVYHQAWEELAERYYPSERLSDWAAWEHKYVGKLNNEDDLDAAVDAMIARLGDRWTRHFSLKDSLLKETDRRLGCVDLGISVEREQGGGFRLSYLHGGTAAYVSPLSKGDLLLAVGGKPTAGLSLVDVERSLCAKDGQRVALTIERRGASATLMLTDEPAVERKSAARLLAGGVLYVNLAEFSNDAVKEFEDAIVAALGADDSDAVSVTGVVFDLRANPGGDVELTADVAAMFMAAGPVLRYNYRDGRLAHDDLVHVLPQQPYERQDEPAAVLAVARALHGKPLVLLVDGSTASSAEVVAQSLRENLHARLVGTTTWGKAVAYTEETLKNGSTLRLTIGRMRAPSNFDWAVVGITPDVVVERAPTGKTDSQLEAALALLAKKG